MTDYFDLSTVELSENGFGLFSLGHFSWLIIGLVFTVIMSSIYRKTSRKSLMRKIVSLSALLLEIFKAVLLACQGQYGIGRLPLHLCGIAVYIIFVHSFFSNTKLWQYMYAFCFPGALFALIFPDWSYYPLFNFLTSASFEIHILIVCYILMQLYDTKPDIKSAPLNLLIMLSLAVPVYVFDKLTNTNYMFLNWPVMPLTVFSFLGSPGYLLGYIPLTAVCWTVMYLPFIHRNNP